MAEVGTGSPGELYGTETAVEGRLVAWRGGYRLDTPEREWVFRLMVVSSVRLDVCLRRESLLRTHLAFRALHCWDSDRRGEAEEVGAGLRRAPAKVVARLRRTKQGCQWLLERWRLLGEALGEDLEWTDEQSVLALDLLGVPEALRDTNDSFSHEEARALVDDAIATLERLQAESLDALDDRDRRAAAEGLPTVLPPALASLRREEAAIHRTFLWARGRLIDEESPSTSPSPSRPDRPPIPDRRDVSDRPAAPSGLPLERPGTLTPPSPPPLNRRARRAALRRQRSHGAPVPRTP